MRIKLYFTESTLNGNINTLDITEATANCLSRDGIFTVDDLYNRFAYLSKLRGLGAKKLNEINNALICAASKIEFVEV